MGCLHEESFTLLQHSRRFETSCFECGTQIRDGKQVCNQTEIWGRMGVALEKLKPYIRVFQSEKDLEKTIEDRQYPKTATVSVDGNAPISVPQQICGAVAFVDAPSSLLAARQASELKFALRTNYSDSLNVAYGYATRQTVVARASTMWSLTYLRSSFLGLQGLVNEFLQCKDDTQVRSFPANSCSATTTPRFLQCRDDVHCWFMTFQCLPPAPARLHRSITAVLDHAHVRVLNTAVLSGCTRVLDITWT